MHALSCDLIITFIHLYDNPLRCLVIFDSRTVGSELENGVELHIILGEEMDAITFCLLDWYFTEGTINSVKIRDFGRRWAVIIKVKASVCCTVVLPSCRSQSCKHSLKRDIFVSFLSIEPLERPIINRARLVSGFLRGLLPELVPPPAAPPPLDPHKLLPLPWILHP